MAISKENMSGLGGAVASLLAAVCCLGPAVAIVTGVSVGFLSGLMVLDPLRPWLLAAAALFLGYSFFRLYVRPKTCRCDADARARRVSVVIFWSGLALFLAAASYQWILSGIYG